MANMELITSVTVGSGGAASVTLPATGTIPATYTDLQVFVSSRGNSSGVAEANRIHFNGDTTNTNYTAKRLLGSGTAASSDQTATIVPGFFNNRTSSTASTFSNSIVYIPNYSSSNSKSYSIDTVTENNATEAYMALLAVNWSGTAAITTMTFTPESSALFVEGSTFYLYGISNVTSGSKATGGIVSSDGTYWYHMFPYSGTFTPTSAISADILCIAGGAAGGFDGGGGGGAGGIIYFASKSLTTTAYTIAVGAGGAGGGTTFGNAGGNSSFGGETVASGGGGGGSGNVNNSKAGGSGGGGGAQGSQPGNSSNQSSTGATAIYGNSGGTGSNSGSGGGGGGAGAAGVSSSSSSAGGAGTNAFSSWASATQTGVDNGYYAGGGGGGTGFGVPGGTGGIGGGGYGGGPNSVQPSAGIVNTGGGGGGGNGNPATSASGGSGLVIIRYAI